MQGSSGEKWFRDRIANWAPKFKKVLEARKKEATFLQPLNSILEDLIILN